MRYSCKKITKNEWKEHEFTAEILHTQNEWLLYKTTIFLPQLGQFTGLQF